MATPKVPLRAVTEADQPKAPKSLHEATERSERSLLVMMRYKIAAEIDGGVPPHTLAPLCRQLREIDKEIRALDLAAEEAGRSGEATPDEEFDASAV